MKTCIKCECWDQYITRRDWGLCELQHRGTHHDDGCSDKVFAAMLRRARWVLERAERQAQRREETKS